MKFLYSVQRYGEGIVGGSESATRLLAEQLVRRGHSVDVLTSCAISYIDWADEYAPGIEVINGVTVHRLPVIAPRDDSAFGPIHQRVLERPRSTPYSDQQRWIQMMGPELSGHVEWLLQNYQKFDVAIFMTYLYTTTTMGLPVLSGLLPTILQPTAHEEQMAMASVFLSLFQQPDAFLFFTPEEKLVVEKLYGIRPHGSIIGLGIGDKLTDLDVPGFCKKFSVIENQYLIYVGRIDQAKAVGELISFFQAMKLRGSSSLKLVLVGEEIIEVPKDPNIIVTGFLSESEKESAIAGALALVQPSYFESFSIVLCEGWKQSTPALVQGKCAVLRGQAIRSGGAIPYEGFAEFEVAVEYLVANPEVASALGASGREYVQKNYDWEIVLDRLEQTVVLAQERFSQRRL